MNAQSKITKANPVADALVAYGDDGAAIPSWGHAPSQFDWQVLIYGGTDPRTGFAQTAQVYQYFRGDYTLADALVRANRGAGNSNRERFAVRDTDGRVVFNGPVHNALGAPVAMQVAA